MQKSLQRSETLCEVITKRFPPDLKNDFLQQKDFFFA